MCLRYLTVSLIIVKLASGNKIFAFLPYWSNHFNVMLIKFVRLHLYELSLVLQGMVNDFP